MTNEDKVDMHYLLKARQEVSEQHEDVDPVGTVIGIDTLHDVAKNICRIDTSDMTVGDIAEAVRNYLSEPHYKLDEATQHQIEIMRIAFGVKSPSDVLNAKPRILDSGDRTEFPSGAVRDTREGKGRCDLLPLDVVADYIYADNYGTDVILRNIYSFQEDHSVSHLYSALNAFRENGAFDSDYTMILEVAKHFEEGAKKYGDNNWRKGIPVRCYIDSAVRHYLKCLRGDKDEPHDRAFCWNILCCIWTVKHVEVVNEEAKENV